MPKLYLTLDEHLQHGPALYKAYDMLIQELTFFMNNLGKRHLITLALKRSLKALDEARDIADNLFYHENPEYDYPSPYYAGFSKFP